VGLNFHGQRDFSCGEEKRMAAGKRLRVLSPVLSLVGTTLAKQLQRFTHDRTHNLHAITLYAVALLRARIP
jgi:hypothetical protein